MSPSLIPAESQLTYENMATALYRTQLNLEVSSGWRTQEESEKRMQKLIAFIGNCRDRKGTVSFGTARDASMKIVQPEILEFSDLLHEHLVQKKLAAANGYGDCGLMGHDFRSRVKAWKKDFNRAKSAPFVGVPLLFQGTKTEKAMRPSEIFAEIDFLQRKETRKKAVICSPKHASCCIAN